MLPYIPNLKTLATPDNTLTMLIQHIPVWFTPTFLLWMDPNDGYLDINVVVNVS